MIHSTRHNRTPKFCEHVKFGPNGVEECLQDPNHDGPHDFERSPQPVDDFQKEEVEA